MIIRPDSANVDQDGRTEALAAARERIAATLVSLNEEGVLRIRSGSTSSAVDAILAALDGWTLVPKGLVKAAEATAEAVGAVYYWHELHEKNNPGHRCGFAAGYTFNVSLKERADALRAALETNHE